MPDIQQILNAIERVKPFPNVVLKAMNMLRDPYIPVTKLVEVIQYDPIITMRVLKICNSAYFGLRKKVESLSHALVLLGNDQTRRVLMTSGALEFLDGQYSGYGLDQGELWRHAVAVALMSQVLMRGMGLPEDHGLFTGAILHDVGKTILNAYADKESQKILHNVWSNSVSALEAERQILGIDHAQVGSLLAERWQFPENIIEIIGRHHDPVDPDKDSPALCMAHLANLLCLQMGIGVGDRGLATRSAPAVIKALGWSPEILEACISFFWSEYSEVEAFFSLAGTSESTGR